MEALKRCTIRIIFCSISLFLIANNSAFAQPMDIPSHIEPYMLNSGVHNGQKNDLSQFTLAFSEVIRVNGVPWLRLQFVDVNLGMDSYLIITSLKDGAWQRLNAVSIAQWQNSSAYFNGEAVKLDLFTAKNDEGIFVLMSELIVGDKAQGSAVRSQCGPTDDRISSNHPAVGRIMSIGCTGWIISNNKFVTAGHCLGGGASVLQFNVPPSLPNGTTQNPGPEDQYAIDLASQIGISGGVGNDWGIFKVFNNSITGLQPVDAQGDFFLVVQNLTPPDIRITGFGVDDGVDNQTQQTHVGPNMGSSGTTMRYQTDTQGGNSGSPVIDDTTGFALGVHTHGGCSVSGGNNSGTSAFHPDFWAAIGPQIIPNAPTAFSAYSDYTTPSSMELTWIDPTNLTSGDTLLPAEFSVLIQRDAAIIDTVAGGLQLFVDDSLVDGTEYFYEITVLLDSLGVTSDGAQASWIAGGSPIPNPPANFNVSGSQNEVTVSWINPKENIDGTPMDDFAGINFYQNGVLAATFARTSADTGAVESEIFIPSTPGFYEWYATAFDNELPLNNESDPTATFGTPLGVPISDDFSIPGNPNPGIWINTDTDINDRGKNPPTGPYALNLNGMPNGEDIIDLKPVDLSTLAGSGVRLAYYYQPQGNGNAPEPEDSLQVYFKNDLGDWVLVKFYEGTPLLPFTQEIIDIGTAPNGGGGYFFGQFQVRFRSTGGAGIFPNDDWFIDDVSLELPVGIEDEAENIPLTFSVKPNYPNPFNPETTIEYQLPQISEVTLIIYNTLGQRVRTLVNKTLESGYHQAVWDGRNDQGKMVSSGIYLYRFEADNFRHIQKMILLK